jgi:hypothetical protein
MRIPCKVSRRWMHFSYIIICVGLGLRRSRDPTAAPCSAATGNTRRPPVENSIRASPGGMSTRRHRFRRFTTWAPLLSESAAPSTPLSRTNDANPRSRCKPFWTTCFIFSSFPAAVYLKVCSFYQREFRRRVAIERTRKVAMRVPGQLFKPKHT